MSFSVEQVRAIGAVSATVSTLSVLGSSFIIVCYFAYPHLRKFAFRLVCILSFNDFFNQLSDFIGPSPEEIVRMQKPGVDPSEQCLAQSVLESFFELSSVMWTTAIAATLYMSVILRMSAEDIQNRFWVMVLVCSGVPLLLTIIPGALGAYGVAGAWCWIRDGELSYWRFIQFYIPLVLAVGFNAYVYVVVRQLIARTLSATGRGGRPDAGAEAMAAVVAKLQFFPFILVVLWFPGILNRLVQLITGDNVFALFLLQKLFSSLQGFLNAFAYGFSAGVREALRASLSPYLPCIAPDDQHDSELLAQGQSRGAKTKGGLEAELDADVGYGGGTLESSREEDDDANSAVGAGTASERTFLGADSTGRPSDAAPPIRPGDVHTPNPLQNTAALPRHDRVKAMMADTDVEEH